MFGAVETLASRFDPDQPHRLILDKVGERAHRVGATAYAGDNGVGQPSFFLQYLRPRLLADHALEFPHHQRKGMRPGDRSEEHTSELQALMRISFAVFLLTKKSIHQNTNSNPDIIHTQKL